MWIRSQSKKVLVNINFLRVINDGNYCLICGATTDGCDCGLGVYSTEKKALRVLDEIQKYIGSERFYSTTKGISEQQSISIENTNVFKMPQDEDVKL